MAIVRLIQVNNTKAHTLHIGNHALHFSYETCVAYEGPLGRARIENHWGPTTGRHMRQLGVKDFPVVSDDEFETRTIALILNASHSAWTDKVVPTEDAHA